MSAEAAATDTQRLAKLWEAYRVQEDEYREAVARVERLAAELGARDHAAAEREGFLQQKEHEIATLHKTIAQRDARIADLETVEASLAAIDKYQARIDELEAAYAQEKERLAKLYLLYEEAVQAANLPVDKQ